MERDVEAGTDLEVRRDVELSLFKVDNLMRKDLEGTRVEHVFVGQVKGDLIPIANSFGRIIDAIRNADPHLTAEQTQEIEHARVTASIVDSAPSLGGHDHPGGPAPTGREHSEAVGIITVAVHRNERDETEVTINACANCK